MTRSRRWLPVAATAVAAVVLSVAARGPGTLPGDLRCARWVQRAPARLGDPVAWLGNTVGSTAGVLAVLVVAAGFLLWRGRRHDALAFVLTIAWHLINTPLKRLLESPRPSAAQVRVDHAFGGLGFPSGHAMSGVQLAGALAILIAGTPAWRGRSALLALPLTVGFGRVWVGAHWPSDVLGGWLWGLLGVLLVRWARARWPGKLAERAPYTDRPMP